MTTIEFHNPWPLIRALSNGVLYSEKEPETDYPETGCIYLTYKGGELKMAATDRYCAIVETIEHKVPDPGDWGPDFAILLDRADAQHAVKALKQVAPRRDYEPWPMYLVVNGDRATLSLYNQEVHYNITRDPKSGSHALQRVEREIIGKAKTSTEAVVRIAFSAKFLASLTKVQTGSRLDTVKLTFSGEGRPALVDFYDGPRVAVMPKRNG